jgi:Ras-related protein Rab-1A
MDLSHYSTFEYYFKILIIGESGVGKTCLLMNFMEETYDKVEATIGLDFKHKIVCYDGKSVKLQVWDTAGQERFKTLTKSYFKIANGVILVFDLTNESSFLDLNNWIKLLDNNTGEGVERILVGNKSDLVDKRRVSYETALNFANKLNIKYFETSNVSHINIDMVFYELTSQILQKYNDYLSTQAENLQFDKNKSLLSMSSSNDKKSNCC